MFQFIFFYSTLMGIRFEQNIRMCMHLAVLCSKDLSVAAVDSNLVILDFPAYFFFNLISQRLIFFKLILR